jgi:spore maturation protein CgeB
MQICDCPDLVADVFEVGREIDVYRGFDDLLEKLRYYLENDSHRQAIASAGHARVLRDYRIAQVNLRAAALIAKAI